MVGLHTKFAWTVWKGIMNFKKLKSVYPLNIAYMQPLRETLRYFNYWPQLLERKIHLANYLDKLNGLLQIITHSPSQSGSSISYHGFYICTPFEVLHGI